MLASDKPCEAARLAGYRPLALSAGWVLERFHGWSVLSQEPALKLLERRVGPLTRHLILACGAERSAVDDLASRHAIFRGLGIVSFNDFSATDEEAVRVVAGRAMLRVVGPRWFGAGTYVIDLGEDEGTLWQRIAARERGSCRSAERRGVRVELVDSPSTPDLEEFHQLHDATARQRNLPRLQRPVLQAISASGCLTLARCADATGRTVVANLLYRAHGQGYFLAGARAPDTPPGAGPLAHWEVIRALKQAGYAFYDLGLVASLDPGDGIHRFKSSLGGAFHSSGSEFERMSPLLAWVRRLRDGWRIRGRDV